MKTKLLVAICALMAVMYTVSSSANRMTELYIPIGQSPGVSGVLTTIGKITSRSGSTIEITSDRGTESCQIGSETMIWLDNSASGQKNKDGSLGDLQTGRQVEILFVHPEQRRIAVWIKVQP